jgi:hypothetical protein
MLHRTTLTSFQSVSSLNFEPSHPIIRAMCINGTLPLAVSGLQSTRSPPAFCVSWLFDAAICFLHYTTILNPIREAVFWPTVRSACHRARRDYPAPSLHSILFYHRGFAGPSRFPNFVPNWKHILRFQDPVVSRISVAVTCGASSFRLAFTTTPLAHCIP